MEDFKNTEVQKRGIFNEDGDLELSKRRIIQGNTTNLNDFNNLKYAWTMDWYRQSMNNFWIPEEINVNPDRIDYENLSETEKKITDLLLANILSLDSIQSANLPNLQVYLTANEINLCLSIATYQEAIHSQSISYILETLKGRAGSREVMDLRLSNERIKDHSEKFAQIYEDFEENKDEISFVKNLIANYIIEGISFYPAYAFFYNLDKAGKLQGIAQQLRHINRDEANHLLLFKNILNDLRAERTDLFGSAELKTYTAMIEDAVNDEIDFVKYVFEDGADGLLASDIVDYLKHLGNTRARAIGLSPIFVGYEEVPAGMRWIDGASSLTAKSNEFMEEKVTSHSQSSFIEDDL